MEYLQLHYYLKNNVHSMDAFIQNKAESELLKLFNETIILLNLQTDVKIEVIAFEEGGLKAFYKFIGKKKNQKTGKKILIYIGVILSGVLTNVLSEQLNKDSEKEKQDKIEQNLRIQKLTKDLEESPEPGKVIITNITINIGDTSKVKLFKSNFYKTISNDSDIEMISTQVMDKNKLPIEPERKVKREQFEKFIIEEIEIDSEIKEDCDIEIVSPVLIGRKIKWKGYYEKRLISFELDDYQFSKLVDQRKISFSNGTSIICDLEFEKKMDNDGQAKTSKIIASNVTFVINGSQTIKLKEIYDEDNLSSEDSDR